jgi:hypothetical protein
MATDPDRKKALPANDAWTGMLVVSLVALLGACALLFLDWRHYRDKPQKMPDIPPITLSHDEEVGAPLPKGGSGDGATGDDKKGEKKGEDKKGEKK